MLIVLKGGVRNNDNDDFDKRNFSNRVSCEDKEEISYGSCVAA